MQTVEDLTMYVDSDLKEMKKLGRMLSLHAEVALKFCN